MRKCYIVALVNYMPPRRLAPDAGGMVQLCLKDPPRVVVTWYEKGKLPWEHLLVDQISECGTLDGARIIAECYSKSHKVELLVARVEWFNRSVEVK